MISLRGAACSLLRVVPLCMRRSEKVGVAGRFDPFARLIRTLVLKFHALQELKESFNYGLFCPPVNGKAGKFLDEERRLGDYPFNGPVGYLEVRDALFIPIVLLEFPSPVDRSQS